ncbi:MAG: glycosyltransferase family 9 protein [Gemmatimonadota bacterium]|jgi:heptosyltransferase I
MAERPTGPADPETDPGEPVRSILIVMLSALGDAVHVLPVANALRRKWPEARITWVIQPVPLALVRDHPAVDAFIPFRRRRGTSAWRSYAELRQRFRGQRFDLALALQVYFKAGLITAMAPARTKLGFDRARARDLNWLFSTHRIPPRPVGHVQDQYFEFLEYLGIDPAPIEWKLELSDDERAAQRAFFERLDRPACAVVVGTSKPGKNWSPDRYAAALDRIEAEHGLRPVLVGGPSAIEREAADRILAVTKARVVDALADDVRRLVWLLDGSRIAISPDTGPLHIARALDVPVVGLFGYTNPIRYGPYRKFTDLIVDGYAEYPGERYPCSMRYREGGMARVGVDEVVEKVAFGLDASPRGS